MKKYFQGCAVNKYVNITSVFTIYEKIFEDTYYFDGESHDFWEFVCVLDGSLGVTAGEDVCILERGQSVLHRPMEFHRLWSEKKTEPHICVISFAADVMPQIKEKQFQLTEEEYNSISGLMERAGSIFNRDREILVKGVHSGKEAESQIFFNTFESFLLSVLTEKTPGMDAYVSVSADNYRSIVRTLEKHITEHLTQADIAGLCNMSPASLKKTFSKYAGIGIMTYFTQMKIRRAMELLKEGCGINETAEVLGFCDRNYFSTVFKRITGESPANYLRKQQQKSRGKIQQNISAQNVIRYQI